nr:ribonuclease H-like domain-containing protein [Tanacetum cinerariifolium]
MPARMQSPYRKQSRTCLEATRNQRRCRRPFSSRIMKTLLHHEDANLKLLRSLPSAWNNIALIMRNKSDLDTLSMDDLYNNLKVYESEIKSQSSLILNSQNVAFVSLDNPSITNKTVNIAHCVSAASSKDQAFIASYVDDVMTKVECYNYHRRGHFNIEFRAPRIQGNRNRDALTRNAPMDTSTTNALVVQDRIGGYDWSFQAAEELPNFALMAHISSSSNKTGLGYDGHVNKSKVLNNVVDSCESDDNQVNDSLDNSVLKSKLSETIISVHKNEVNASKASKDSLEKSKTVRSSAPVIEDWESDGEDKNVFKPIKVKKIVKPSLEKIEFVNTRNTTVKNENKDEKPRKFSQSPRGEKRNWNGLMTQKLGDAKTNNFNEKVNTAKVNNVTTAGTKVVVITAEEKRNNDVKSSACWISRPKGNLIDHISKDSGSYTLKRFNYVDLQGRLKHMIGNKSYLTNYQELDCGFVAFGGNANGGKITGKGGLACLFTKATLDESNLWHRRLGHIKFKTMNKLVRENLVRGLPFKVLKMTIHVLLFRRKSNTKPPLRPRLVLVIKPHNKTPYELFLGREPALSFMGPFGCPITILNTFDHLGNQNNGNVGTKANINAGQAVNKIVPGPQYVLLPLFTIAFQGPKSPEDEIADEAGKKSTKVQRKENEVQDLAKKDNKNDQEKDLRDQEEAYRNQFKQEYERLSIPINAATLLNVDLPTNPLMPDLEDTADLQDFGIFSGAYDDEVKGAKADFNNLELTTVFNHMASLAEKDMYDSWKSRMELYMLNRQHGRMILKSVEQAEAIQADCDVKATNIILQGLPPEV